MIKFTSLRKFLPKNETTEAWLDETEIRCELAEFTLDVLKPKDEKYH